MQDARWDVTRDVIWKMTFELDVLLEPEAHLVWGCRAQGPGFRVQGTQFRDKGLGFRVQGSGFRVQGT